MAKDYTFKSAEDVSSDQWREIVALNYRAVAATGGPRVLAHPYVRRSIGLDGADAYAERRRNPQKPNQSFRNPRISLALSESGKIAAVAWSCLNTSGEDAAEADKKMEASSPKQRWSYIGWLATHPDHQRQGHATTLIRKIVEIAEPGQPVSAFAWPNRDAGQRPLLHTALSENGFGLFGEPAVMPDLRPGLTGLPEIPTDRYVRLPQMLDITR